MLQAAQDRLLKHNLGFGLGLTCGFLIPTSQILADAVWVLGLIFLVFSRRFFRSWSFPYPGAIVIAYLIALNVETYVLLKYWLGAF